MKTLTLKILVLFNIFFWLNSVPVYARQDKPDTPKKALQTIGPVVKELGRALEAENDEKIKELAKKIRNR